MFEQARRHHLGRTMDEHLPHPRRPVVPLLRGGGEEPARLDPGGDDAGGDRHPLPDEPHGGHAVHEGHELQQRGRAVGRRAGVQRRGGRAPGRRRETAGCSRWPAPTPTSTPTSPTATPSTPSPAVGIAGRAALAEAGPHHRRHRPRRPLLVLPGGGAGGCRRARPRPRPPAHPDRRTELCRRSVEQLRDALDRGDGRGPARRPGNHRPGLGQRRLPHQARLRDLLHRAARRRLPTRPPPGRDRRLPSREVAADHEGEATIETWAVMHDKDGEPEQAIVALLLDDGRRAWGTTDDADTVATMVAQDMIGRRVHRRPRAGSASPADRQPIPRPTSVPPGGHGCRPERAAT